MSEKKTIEERQPVLESWQLRAALVVLAIAGWAVTYRVTSYASGQDPRIYLDLAQKIRLAGYTPASIATCADWIVPGFPLLLAVAIEAAGLFAAFWINLPVFLLALWPLSIVTKRMTGGSRAGVAILYGFWVALVGYPLNPHFMFMPFRGMVEWAFVFGAVASASPVLDPDTPLPSRVRRAFLTSGLILVGVIFRETVGMVMIPIAFILFWGGCRQDRNAWRVLAAFLGPVVAGGVVFVAWRMQGGEVLTMQSRVWLESLLRFGYERPFANVLINILQTIKAELGISGLVFLLAGLVVAARRREKNAAILTATAFILAVFYAMFQSHMRYTLTSVWLLAIVSGSGFAAIVEWILGRLPRRMQKTAGVSVFCGLIALIAYGVATTVTWGPQVSRADITSLQGHPLASRPVIFVDRANRMVIDAISAYTHAAPKDPAYELENIRNYAGSYYIRTQDDNAKFDTISGVGGEDWILRYFDIKPTGDHFSIGGIIYDILSIEPWSTRDMTLRVSCSNAPSGGVLWLDFRSGVPTGTVDVVTRDADGANDVAVRLNQPAGFVAIWLTPGITAGTDIVVTVTSDASIPEELDPVFVPAGHTFWIPMEQGRPPSSSGLLGPGFANTRPMKKHAASLESNAVIRLPGLRASNANQPVKASLVLLPQPTSSDPVRGVLMPNGNADARVEWAIRPGHHNTRVSWSGMPTNASEGVELQLAVTNLPESVWYVRVEYVGIAFGARADSP